MANFLILSINVWTMNFPDLLHFQYTPDQYANLKSVVVVVVFFLVRLASSPLLASWSALRSSGSFPQLIDKLLGECDRKGEGIGRVERGVKT